MLQHKSRALCLLLSFPPLEPLPHLDSRALTPHIHRRNHLCPIQRESKARQFEEGRMFRVRDGVKLEGRSRSARCVKIFVGEIVLLSSVHDCGHRRIEIGAFWWRIPGLW